MSAVPVIISLLVLFDSSLAQAQSDPKSVISLFSGFLYHNFSLVNDTEKLEKENKSMQVQADVCRQLTILVPWYRAEENRSTCTIKIGRQQTQVQYSILATDDFLRKYDPSCVTYEILLANQVARSPAFENKYYLTHIKLENRSRTQPFGPIPADMELTTVRVDGPLYKSAGRLRWDEFNNFDDVTKEVGENVRRQFVSFLHLDPNNGSYIKTERRSIYREPRHQTFTRMEAQITFNNSMLAANGINYTCPPFKELVNESLNSIFFQSNTSYLWRPVNILEETPDRRSTDRRSTDAPTSSPASEQTSTGSDSITTVRTTTRGDVARITWHLISIMSPLLTSSALLVVL